MVPMTYSTRESDVNNARTFGAAEFVAVHLAVAGVDDESDGRRRRGDDSGEIETIAIPGGGVKEVLAGRGRRWGKEMLEV